MLKKQILAELLEILLALIDKHIVQVEAKLNTISYIVNEPLDDGVSPEYEKKDALRRLEKLRELLGCDR